MANVEEAKALEPVRKKVVVPASPEVAFRRFTAEIGSWWPLGSYSIHGAGGSVEFGAAVGERTTVASYPFAARVQPEPASGYRVEGTVDTGTGDAPLARYNYECLVSGAGAPTMTVDSLALWQSH